MSVESPPIVKCDWPPCARTVSMTGAPFAWMLPAGWVMIDQSLGYYAGGTMPIPPEVDVYFNGRTFCSVAHMAHAALDVLKQEKTIAEEAQPE